MTTYSAKPSEIEKKWVLIDADGLVVGRLAALTGYIGGIKERTAGAIMAGKYPERVVEKAVERMIPRGPLGKRQMSNLRVYPGAEHPHEAQQPETVDIAALNPKNSNFRKAS